MAARDSLVAYGYVQCEDGKYRRPGKNTQVWQELAGGKGWLRFDPDGQGKEVPEVYQVNSNYQGTSGLHKLHHPGAFDWVYPEEEVEKIYSEAVTVAADRLHAARERKGQLADSLRGGAVVQPTEGQMASMQNAQAGQAAAATPEAKEPERKRHWWD
mgnify:FL=1